MKRRDNVFDETQMSRVESNQFDLSHTKKWTGNMGELIPTACIEVVPGDEFNISFVQMLRMMPMVAPVMHKVRVFTEWFFVPNRILWSEWEDFITGTGTPAHPFILVDDVFDKGTIGDYLGIPPGDYSDNPIQLNAFQIAAIFMIFDEWYRDQNVIDPKYVPLVSGSNNSNYFNFLNGPPLRRAWERDLFTSALPTTQQGLTGVEIPLTFQDDIPVEFATGAGNPHMRNPTTGVNSADGDVVVSGGGGTLRVDANQAAYDPAGHLVVDIQSQAATINDLREAWALQTFLERSIRGGLRYFEQLWSHFKTKSPDARLQRPEFIGRAEQVVTISEVLATAQSSDDATTAEVPVGQMAGHGISVGGRDGIYYKALEHGFIIGITSLRPDTCYQDGLHKSFSKVDRLDYMWPDFAHIGEEPVLLKEIQAVVNSSHDPETVFGYQPRYYAYRYLPDSVAGDFRDNLAYWTLSRQFNDPAQPPTLSQEFIQCDPRFDIFAVEDANVDHIIGQTIHKITVNRKLPRFGVPATIV